MRTLRERVGEGGVTRVAKNRSRMRAQNYSGARFIASTRGPMPGPSPALGPAGYWEVELR